jgi:hypothetical protein
VSVPQEPATAYLWLNLAAARYTSAQPKLRASAEAARDRVAARLSPDELAAAQRASADWKPK